MSEVVKSQKIKLPPRYPKEKIILIFGDMSELDHVFELLEEMGQTLINLPPDVTLEEWRRCATDPLTHLIKMLKIAYIEFEQFWEVEGWSFSEDSELAADLSCASDLWWRVKELEDGRLIDIPARGNLPAKIGRAYDPAHASCAKALYLALGIQESPGSNEYIEYVMSSLRYELTRYHAAALEVVQYRTSVYLKAANDQSKANAPSVETGDKIRASAKSRADSQKIEAKTRAEEIIKKYNELHVGNRSKTQAVAMTAKALSIGIATVWKAFNRV